MILKLNKGACSHRFCNQAQTPIVLTSTSSAQGGHDAFLSLHWWDVRRENLVKKLSGTLKDSASSAENNFKSYNYSLLPTPFGELARKSTCLLKTETETDSASSAENNFKSYNYSILPTPIGELAHKSICLLKTETETDSASSAENNFKSYNYSILPTPIGELARKSTCLLKTETETETDSASSAENNFKSYNYSHCLLQLVSLLANQPAY